MLPAALRQLIGSASVLAWHDPNHTVAWIFVIAGILLLLWETTMPGFFIAVPAVVLIFVGLYGFIFPQLLFSVYSPILAILVAVPTTFGTLAFYKRIAPATAAPFTTVGDSLRGQVGQVTVEVQPDTTRGKVRIRNQVWSATADESIPVGAKVRVVLSEGVHVKVERVPTETPDGPMAPRAPPTEGKARGDGPSEASGAGRGGGA